MADTMVHPRSTEALEWDELLGIRAQIEEEDELGSGGEKGWAADDDEDEDEWDEEEDEDWDDEDEDEWEEEDDADWEEEDE